jgi:hypothetical protein
MNHEDLLKDLKEVIGQRLPIASLRQQRGVQDRMISASCF